MAFKVIHIDFRISMRTKGPGAHRTVLSWCLSIFIRPLCYLTFAQRESSWHLNGRAVPTPSGSVCFTPKCNSPHQLKAFGFQVKHATWQRLPCSHSDSWCHSVSWWETGYKIVDNTSKTLQIKVLNAYEDSLTLKTAAWWVTLMDICVFGWIIKTPACWLVGEFLLLQDLTIRTAR